MERNCAPEVPRRGCAPTGFRRLTPGLMKAERTAGTFDGLPEGVKSPGQLLAAFKAAAPRLGLSLRLVHAIDWLFRYTQPQDWEKGDSHPIVWPSAGLQQAELGLSETQAKWVNRQLGEAGLVTMRDSPNGKRYGKRDQKGRIVEAYGFDLAPIAARHAEFVQLAEEGRAERAAIGRLRRRATIARRGIAQILETAAEYGYAGAEWSTLADESRAIARAVSQSEALEDIEAAVISLERRQTAAKTRLEELLKVVDSDPKQPEIRPHQYNYKPNLYPQEDTVIASRNCSSVPAGTRSSPPGQQHRERDDQGTVLKLSPDELVRLAPRLRPYLRRSDPTWPDIVEAADWLRHDLTVSKPLWGQACLALGREQAAIALAIVSTKDEAHFRTSPGGYFRGMIARAERGELHLSKTLWALRRAADPERPPTTDRGGEGRRGESRPPWS